MYERIKKLCAGKGWSLSALEVRLGFGVGAIGKWKTSSPKADNLALVAHALDVSMEYLLTGEEKPAAEDGDGLTEVQRELIAEVKRLPEPAAVALLAVARQLEAAHTVPGAG